MRARAGAAPGMMTGGWLRAGGVSCGVHAMALLGVGIGAWIERSRSPVGPPTGFDAPLEAIATVDLSVLDDWPASGPAPPPAPVPRSPWREGEEPAHAWLTTVPPAPGPPEHRRVAPDRGSGQGRMAEDIAWRRDASTLHERLTDGAPRYQPAHTRTAAGHTVASPQSVRRQPIVASGDSPSASRVEGAPLTDTYGMPDPDSLLRGGQPAEVVPRPPAVAVTAMRAHEQVGTSRAEGPLDAEQGPTSFDVKQSGPPADDRAIRAASMETHPSVTDLSAPAAPGPGQDRRGPAEVVGGAVRATAGVAPASPGHLGPSTGFSAESTARERIHARYVLEIRARVNRALAWPRALAIRLEQGETMVAFGVAPDGRVEGPVLVTKSAGFEEFDRAAVDAVRRASPFPPFPADISDHPRQPLPVSLRVTFSNPVIR